MVVYLSFHKCWSFVSEVCSSHMIYHCDSRPTMSDYYITMYDGSRFIDGANRVQKPGQDALELNSMRRHT